MKYEEQSDCTSFIFLLGSFAKSPSMKSTHERFSHQSVFMLLVRFLVLETSSKGT